MWNFVRITHCISSLLLHIKLPNSQQLKTTAFTSHVFAGRLCARLGWLLACLGTVCVWLMQARLWGDMALPHQ